MLDKTYNIALKKTNILKHCYEFKRYGSVIDC